MTAPIMVIVSLNIRLIFILFLIGDKLHTVDGNLIGGFGDYLLLTEPLLVISRLYASPYLNVVADIEVFGKPRVSAPRYNRYVVRFIIAAVYGNEKVGYLSAERRCAVYGCLADKSVYKQ